MLATDIIKRLKRQIRITWTVILILSLLLFVTNYVCKNNICIHDSGGCECEIINEQKDVHFTARENKEPQKIIAKRRKKRVNVE